ncbi:DUF3080 family protein [Ferrimonas balearica]|uniref:DUF3080 family protein n=1 Tax=Ferrimonas balearica TaxID=44012 RepID=UPI001C993C11|nr:DUF3080 family protein [Ferrimonas balearica]MBY5991539.1 DUF3080 domain-containing protein [Ferrimonas balearica]
MLRWLLKLLPLLLLSGCQPGPDGTLDDYLTRLERVLNTERPAIELTPPPRPAKHLWQPSQTDLTVSLLTPLKLKPCGVLPLIAQHNAQLGRVSPPSQQLLYHHELAHRLTRCDPDSLDEEGRELHQALLTHKAQQLPRLGPRLFLLSDEIWFNLGAEGKGWRFGPLAEAEQSLNALKRMTPRLSVLDEPLDPQQTLESHLAVLYRAELPRSLHRAMISATVTLEQASAMLETLPTLACQHETMTVLPNVLTAIYGERVQPLLSQIQNADRRLTPPLTALLSPLPEDPYFAFYLGQDADSLRGRFYSAIQLHTQTWQTLLERCGQQPGAPTG